MRLRYLLPLLLLSTPIHAAEVDLDTILLGQDGKPKQECVKLNSADRTKCDEEITVTLRWLSMIALDLTPPDEKLIYSEIVKRGRLADKLSLSGKVDLSIDDAKLLKDQIAKVNYSTLIRFQAIKLIDPTGVSDAK